MYVEGNAEVYIKHREELLRYATALVGPNQAEDVVSTVVLRAIGKRSLADMENPRAYLLKGVLNESRGTWRQRRSEQLPEMAVSDPPIELIDVVEAVWRLPIRQRSAVFLFYWEALAVREIAEVMGVGPGTVKRYLHLARKRLKGVL
jgi:RNA polymerase sigma factor (sigma-70 family)